MSIFITGDTHGSGIGQKGLSVDGFMRRLTEESFPEQTGMAKEDYVIICGDFGGVWSTNRFEFSESKSEQEALDWLDNRPFTTLFVPGNHENYDRLTGIKNEKLLNSWLYQYMSYTEREKLRKGYPQKVWHGGNIREIRPSVFMLERGEIFNLGGKYLFAFGGAKSHDIRDGILSPTDFESEEAFETAYDEWRCSKQFRVEGISWWKQEMPTAEEMERGKKNLEAHIARNRKIDFFITHDAPAGDSYYFGFKADKLNIYLQQMEHLAKPKKIFYGHLHENKKVFENHFLLYEQIIQAAK